MHLKWNHWFHVTVWSKTHAQSGCSRGADKIELHGFYSILTSPLKDNVMCLQGLHVCKAWYRVSTGEEKHLPFNEKCVLKLNICTTNINVTGRRLILITVPITTILIIIIIINIIFIIITIFSSLWIMNQQTLYTTNFSFCFWILVWSSCCSLFINFLPAIISLQQKYLISRKVWNHSNIPCTVILTVSLIYQTLV